LHNLLQPE